MSRVLHPTDLAAWRRWQRSTDPLPRRVRAHLSASPDEDAVLTVRGSAPRLLVALDSRTPSSRAALLAPLEHWPHDVAVLAAHDTSDLVGGAVVDEPVEALTDVRAVCALGDYLSVGARAHRLAMSRGVPFVVVQHGLLTPYAPPLPAESLLLAWSAADGEMWRSDRSDVDVVEVGSQLLWQAGGASRAEEGGSTPVYLGQLHAAELDRRLLTTAAERFCSATGASYRPHPAERDRRSRATHRRWERSGIDIDRRGTPVPALDRPVVSVFSTGVLEAAAAGLAAWVDLPGAPPWVTDLWARYGMRQWGEEPTSPPARPSVAPARIIADAWERL